MTLINSLEASIAADLLDLTILIDRISSRLVGVDDLGVAPQAFILAGLRAQRTRLAECESIVEAKVAHGMEGKRLDVPGVGFLERRGGAIRKAWDHRKAAFAVTERLSVDSDGVEVPEVAHTVSLAIDALLDAAGISYWRSGKLSDLGLNADDYCESERGRFTVAIVPATAAEDVA